MWLVNYGKGLAMQQSPFKTRRKKENPNMNSDQVLMTRDVSRLLDVAPETVRQMVRAGKLSADRTAGGIRIYKRGEVERLAAKRREQQLMGRRSAG